MARARNIKPSLFKNEVLGVADPLFTLAFEGLWVLADREGRLEDRPLRIKAETFPYRDGVNMDAILGWLHENGFILRYTIDGANYILVLAFHDHQNPHKNEIESVIPPPDSVPVPIKSEPLRLIPLTFNPIPDSALPKVPKSRRKKGAPFSGYTPDLSAFVNVMLGKWPTVQPGDSGKITIDPDRTIARVKEILGDVSYSIEILTRAYAQYLSTEPRFYKAPQFFWGPDGPWLDFVNGAIHRMSQEVQLAKPA